MDMKPATQWHYSNIPFGYFSVVVVHKRRNCYHIRKPFRFILFAHQSYQYGIGCSMLLHHDDGRETQCSFAICVCIVCMRICCHFYTKISHWISAARRGERERLSNLYALLPDVLLPATAAWFCYAKRHTQCLCVFVPPSTVYMYAWAQVFLYSFQCCTYMKSHQYTTRCVYILFFFFYFIVVLFSSLDLNQFATCKMLCVHFANNIDVMQIVCFIIK